MASNNGVVAFGKLTFKKDDQVMIVAAQVLVSPRQSVHIKIIVHVNGFKLDVFPLHPNRKALVRLQLEAAV